MSGNPIAGGPEIMREYELTVVYNLSLAEAGGADAAVKHLGAAVEARGGKLLKTDHWGRRRMAYPIGQAIDGDYVVSRVELEAPAIAPLEQALRIDERVYRHLIVRADELPAPPPPREPRRQPEQAAAEAGTEAATAPSAEEPATAAAATEAATAPPAEEPATAAAATEASTAPPAEEPASAPPATEADATAPEAQAEAAPAAAAAVESAGDEAPQAEAPAAEPEAAEDQPAPAEPTA